MHQADNYSFAEYMVTEVKKVSDWSTRKIELTRRGGTATVSCDYKGAKPISTQVDDPDDYKPAEGIAVALATEGKKGVRLIVDILYDLEGVVDEEDSAHSEVEQPQPKRARKVRQLKLILIVVTEQSQSTTGSLLEHSKERQEASTGSTNIPTLIWHWRSEEPQRSNNGKPCYIIEERHHMIMSNQLSVWDRQISIGNAAVYNPTPGMVLHLVTKVRLNPPDSLAALQLPAILPPYAFPPTLAYGWPQPFSPPLAP